MQSRATDTILRDRCISWRENKPELIHKYPHSYLRWGMCMLGAKNLIKPLSSPYQQQKRKYSPLQFAISHCPLHVCWFSWSILICTLNSTFISCSYSQQPFPPFSSCFCADMLHSSMQLLAPLGAQMKPLFLITQCLGNFILTIVLTNYKANRTLI